MKELLSQLESEVKRLSSLPISWMARINLSEMLFLPRYIYLIRALPYLIPLPLISRLQKPFLNFIWNNSKPRIQKHYLFLHTKLGAMSVPELLRYNIATIMEPTYILWHHSSVYHWSQLEDASISPSSVRDLLAATLLNSPIPQFTLLSLNLFETWKLHVASNAGYLSTRTPFL